MHIYLQDNANSMKHRVNMKAINYRRLTFIKFGRRNKIILAALNLNSLATEMSVPWWIKGNSLWRGICHIQEWSVTSSAAMTSACIIQMVIKTLIYYLIGCSRSITGLSTSDPSKWLMSQLHHMPLFSLTFKTNYKDTHIVIWGKHLRSLLRLQLSSRSAVHFMGPPLVPYPTVYR